MANPSKTTKNLTKLEQDKADSQKTREDIEEVLYIGESSNAKADAVVQKIEKEKIKTEVETRAKFYEKATRSRKFIDTDYLKSIRDAAVYFIGEIDFRDFDPGWKVYVQATRGGVEKVLGKKFATQRGLLVVLQSPQKLFYHLGMKASFDPKTDINGAWALSVYVENTMDHVSQLKEDKDKIWIPNKN